MPIIKKYILSWIYFFFPIIKSYELFIKNTYSMSEFLEISWVKTHNLKNISVKIPKNKLTVITWLSGSGKSSLAFKTIFNIWQQKYLESLSSYARMFIGGMSEEAIYQDVKWLSPAISIDQKSTNSNPRSTVGTITEIYDYYKILYLNIWERKCIVCGNDIKKDTLASVVDMIAWTQLWTKFLIKSPLVIPQEALSLDQIKSEVLKLGFIRYMIGSDTYTLNDTPNISFPIEKKVYIVLDRLVTSNYDGEDNSDLKRLKDSLTLAFQVGQWLLEVDMFDEKTQEFISHKFSNIFVCSSCGHIPKPLDISSFSFNSPAWSCEECHGLWEIPVFLEENIINPRLTLAEWSLLPWFWSGYYNELVREVCRVHKIDINIPYSTLPQKQKDIILYGDKTIATYKISPENNYSGKVYHAKYKGIINILTEKYFSWDIQSDDKISWFLTYHTCPICHWNRLNLESLSVYFWWVNIGELSQKSVKESIMFFKNISLTSNQEKIAKNVLKNITQRLDFLAWVWLEYMAIARKSNTLSGWESQRIRLATQIWTQLEGIIYVLDEPSIWLHPRDNDMLIDNLKKLRDIWNTLIVVEHDEDIMRNADYIIDIGPGAGVHGWQIVAEWTFEEILKNPHSITAPFLNKTISLHVSHKKRLKKHFLEIQWASQNNLKNIDVEIPLEHLTVVTGVSGSGKSSLVNHILANHLSNQLNGAKRVVGKVDKITWLEYIDKAIVVDQSPIGKTPRSNPATYTGVFTSIREIFASTTEAQVRWYGPGRFSFNTKEWRCPYCDGDGVKKIEMHFLPPVYIKCEYCDGKRYNNETLDISFKSKNIADVLDMTVDEASEFFSNQPKVFKILQVLQSVWLGYIKLGQSSTTLSGGESQRIKLSTELSKKSTSKTFYILDEPTTWLHFWDTLKLLKILHSLVDKWNTVLVIEHNMEVILNADHIIDIWPTGGDEWWQVVVTWDIDIVKKCKKSFTGQAIERYLEG